MTEEPEKVLPKQWRATFMSGELTVNGGQRQKKAGTDVAVHEQKNASREQNSERQQAQDGGDEPRPAGQRHAHQAHALGAHVERGGNEVESAHERRNAENRDADDPEIRAQTLTGSGGLKRAQRRVPGPAVKRRSTHYKKGCQHHDIGDEGRPKRKHVQDGERHVGRADLYGQEIVAAATKGRTAVGEMRWILISRERNMPTKTAVSARK